MKIIEIPEFKDRGNVLQVTESTTVLEACTQMSAKNFGSCLITDKGILKGIFTERDLLVKVISKGLDPKKTKIKEVMTTNPKTANVDDNIFESLRRMNAGRFRHLPVVDAQNKVIGIVSQGDFVAMTWGQFFQRFQQYTVSSFSTHTQLWMIFLGVLLYTLVMITIMKSIF